MAELSGGDQQAGRGSAGRLLPRPPRHGRRLLPPSTPPTPRRQLSRPRPRADCRPVGLGRPPPPLPRPGDAVRAAVLPTPAGAGAGTAPLPSSSPAPLSAAPLPPGGGVSVGPPDCAAAEAAEVAAAGSDAQQPQRSRLRGRREVDAVHSAERPRPGRLRSAEGGVGGGAQRRRRDGGRCLVGRSAAAPHSPPPLPRRSLRGRAQRRRRPPRPPRRPRGHDSRDVASLSPAVAAPRGRASGRPRCPPPPLHPPPRRIPSAPVGRRSARRGGGDGGSGGGPPPPLLCALLLRLPGLRLVVRVSILPAAPPLRLHCGAAVVRASPLAALHLASRVVVHPLVPRFDPQPAGLRQLPRLREDGVERGEPHLLEGGGEPTRARPHAGRRRGGACAAEGEGARAGARNGRGGGAAAGPRRSRAAPLLRLHRPRHPSLPLLCAARNSAAALPSLPIPSSPATRRRTGRRGRVLRIAVHPHLHCRSPASGRPSTLCCRPPRRSQRLSQ